MRRLLVGCEVLLVFCLAGCGESTSGDDEDDGDGNGGTSGSGGTSGGGDVPLEQFPTRIAAAACRIEFECCSEADRADNPFIGSTEAECRTNYGALFTLLVPTVSASVAGGRVRYDADAMGRCLDALDAAGCSPSVADVSCEGAFVPLVRSGGACAQDMECIDSTCLGETGDVDPDGTCGAPLPNGTYCEDDSDCASGYCPFNCEARLPNGSTCSFDEECESDHCDLDAYVCAPPSDDVCG